MPNLVAQPTEGGGWESKNRLLATLADGDFRKLQPHLEAVPLARGSVLYDADEPLTRVHFVESGVASLVTTLENRVTIGVATVGREGVVGVATLLLGGATALGRCQVLVPGSALTMEVSAFRNALRQGTQLRRACQAYTRALLVQLLQAVPCNRIHTAEQRCARWLLMCADRTENDKFELTQEYLAEMLGVPQPTVTAIVRKLQSAGLIDRRRSAIAVVDRRGLETAACECYRIVRDRCQLLLAPAHD